MRVAQRQPKPIKIALTGSHGTGKTTLILALKRELNAKGVALEIVREIPRLVCDAVNDPTFFRQDTNTFAKQALLLQGQIQAELAAVAGSPDVILCDRALLDHWIYTKHFHGSSFADGKVYEAFHSTISRHCKTYDLILYLPIEFTAIDDGVREGGAAFQKAIDTAIKEFLSEEGLQFATLTGSVDERTAVARDLIEKAFQVGQLGQESKLLHSAEPGTAVGATRYVHDADELYHTVLTDVLAQREEIFGGQTKSIGSRKRSKEILHYNLIIAEPRERLLHNEKRKFNLPTAVARFIWMMAGNDRLKDIEFYEPKVGAFSDDGIVVPGSSYGHRMLYPVPGCDQISGVISRLREDAATRRAAIAVYQPQDVTRVSSDIPCTFGLAFHNRGEFLHPAVIMRSNNAFILLPYNIFEFSLLGEAVAAEVGLKLGAMSYYAMSMHVYASDYEKAEDVIRTPANPRAAAVPVMPIDPPPLGQIRELVKIEAEVRHAAAGFSAANFESKWLPFADSRLAPYWRQFYYLLLFAVCQRVGFHSGLIRLSEFIDEPWLSCLPADQAAAPASQLVAQGDLFPDAAKHRLIKPPSQSKMIVREDSTVLSRAELEKELGHVLKLYQPYVARDQWSRVLEHRPIFLRQATTSSDKVTKVLNRLRAFRFSLEAGEKVESHRARAEVIIRALDELTVD